MLSVNNIDTSMWSCKVLRHIAGQLGEMVFIAGRNGAGKTTLPVNRQLSKTVAGSIT